jgi:hypothetical protein
MLSWFRQGIDGGNQALGLRFTPTVSVAKKYGYRHALDCCAVLGAVKAASLRSAAAFRGASGLDRASAQRRLAYT